MPTRAIFEAEVKMSGDAPLPVAIPADPSTVKLRDVVVAVVPVNSSVAPDARTSLVGSLSELAPSELLVSERKAALMTAELPLAAVAPV